MTDFDPEREHLRVVRDDPETAKVFRKSCAAMKAEYDSMPDANTYTCSRPKAEVDEKGRPRITGYELVECHASNLAKFKLLMEARKLGCDWAQD